MSDRQTARAVIFHSDGRVLLVERHKGNMHYFVLPGGHIEQHESAEQAVVREVREETSLSIHVTKLLYTCTDMFGQAESIFLGEADTDDTPVLQPNSIEKRQMSDASQTWEPVWFTVSDLRAQTVYPAGLLENLLRDKANDFQNNPRRIDESTARNR